MTIDWQNLLALIVLLVSIGASFLRLFERGVKLETKLDGMQTNLDNALKRLDKTTDQLQVMWAMLPGANERPSDRVRRAAVDG